MRLSVPFEQEVLDGRVKYPRPRLPPSDLLRVFLAADFADVRHQLARGGGFDDSVVGYPQPLVLFAREDVLVRELEGLEADHVRVRPPAPSVQEELVAKEVRE